MGSDGHHGAVEIICREVLRDLSLIHRKKPTRVILYEPIGMDRVGLVVHEISICVVVVQYHRLTDAVRSEREPAALSMAYGG